ncbi:cobalamin B12-binding domain-containing protein [Amycolatopsis sp. H20-H5]|uniref:cobalamin B12-binding domain-containing protein n=1 Tax=Amycolatopsis sp. H20-H5 TaxID=3046309 RepID=UPI002DB75117|nr:cobalamin-dependent protein [Amycolatopsis sp. H20-H5]MEC3978515.1 cobalamin-dependent protein [Amycolatopsis sp. H20-H5]
MEKPVAAQGKSRGRVLVSSVSSDSHTWNLVYLQLLIEELGFDVVALGACVPDALLVDACLHHDPDAVVLSTVNGHGALDGARVARVVRAIPALAALPMVIGGQLGVAGTADSALGTELLDAGFTAVYPAGSDPMRLAGFLSVLSEELPQKMLPEKVLA